MTTQECHVSYAHLCVARIGNAILYLQTWYGEKIHVSLPPYLTGAIRCLMEHHQQMTNSIEQEIDGFISAKEIAHLTHRFLANIYDMKTYVYRLRCLVRQASKEAIAISSNTVSCLKIGL